MISTKILLSLSALAVLVITCQANLIKGGNSMEVQERHETAMDDDDRMKALSWLNNRRSDYENTEEDFKAKSKRGIFKVLDENSPNTSPMPLHVNPLKDYLYRADEDNKQKILYVSCGHVVLNY